MNRKITFNKASVILMYVMIIGLFLFCFITSAYPPCEFTYCWFIFWISQAVITCVLEINKRGHKKKEEERTVKIRFLEAIEPYINENNATELIRKYIGIEPTYQKYKADKGGKKNGI